MVDPLRDDLSCWGDETMIREPASEVVRTQWMRLKRMLAAACSRYLSVFWKELSSGLGHSIHVHDADRDERPPRR